MKKEPKNRVVMRFPALCTSLSFPLDGTPAPEEERNLRHKDSEGIKLRDLQVRTDNIFHGLSALFFILFSFKINEITFNSGTDKLISSF